MSFAKLCSLLKQEQNFSSPQAESWFARESPQKPCSIHSFEREKDLSHFFPFASLFSFFLYIFSCLLIHSSVLLVFVNHTSYQHSQLILYSGKYLKKEDKYVAKNYDVLRWARWHSTTSHLWTAHLCFACSTSAADHLWTKKFSAVCSAVPKSRGRFCPLSNSLFWMKQWSFSLAFSLAKMEKRRNNLLIWCICSTQITIS